MEMRNVSGYRYPEDPPSLGTFRNDAARYSAISEALKFARESCSRRDRGFYLALLKVSATADALRDGAKPGAVTPNPAEALTIPLWQP